MIQRVGQVWEIKSYLNGERVVVVVNSRPVMTRDGLSATLHDVLHVTGKKLGRILDFTENDDLPWETHHNMLRLD